MSKQELTVNCPNCGTTATQSITSEECSLAHNGIINDLSALLLTCAHPTDLTTFYQDEAGEDPCILCPHNRITESPGSFLHMEDGLKPDTWLEIHLCPHCQSKYSVNTQTKIATLL